MFNLQQSSGIFLLEKSEFFVEHNKATSSLLPSDCGSNLYKTTLIASLKVCKKATKVKMLNHKIK